LRRVCLCQVSVSVSVVLSFPTRRSSDLIWYFSTLDKEAVTQVSNLASNFILFTVIIVFIVMALLKKVNVYEAFIDGAKDGFKTRSEEQTSELQSREKLVCRLPLEKKKY